MSGTSKTETDAYIAQLTPMELKVLNIAKTHLETSFSLEKSIGFLEWQKKNKALAPTPLAPATPTQVPRTKLVIKSATAKSATAKSATAKL